MFLTITGNVDVEETLKIIKENQATKKFEPIKEIVKKEYNEQLNVVKKNEKINMNVSISKLFIGYKINIESLLKKYPKHYVLRYINMYLDIKFGQLSEYIEDLRNENILDEIDFDTIYSNNYIEIIIYADTNYTNKFKEIICSYIKNIDIEESDFNLKKKSFLSSNIYASDNIFKLNNKVISSIVNEKELIFDVYDIYNKLNYQDFIYVINNLDFNNNTILIIDPLSSCQNEKN